VLGESSGITPISEIYVSKRLNFWQFLPTSTDIAFMMVTYPSQAQEYAKSVVFVVFFG
jgi:hypothetical protein